MSSKTSLGISLKCSDLVTRHNTFIASPLWESNIQPRGTKLCQILISAQNFQFSMKTVAQILFTAWGEDKFIYVFYKTRYGLDLWVGWCIIRANKSKIILMIISNNHQNYFEQWALSIMFHHQSSSCSRKWNPAPPFQTSHWRLVQAQYTTSWFIVVIIISPSS